MPGAETASIGLYHLPNAEHLIGVELSELFGYEPATEDEALLDHMLELVSILDPIPEGVKAAARTAFSGIAAACDC